MTTTIDLPAVTAPNPNRTPPLPHGRVAKQVPLQSAGQGGSRSQNVTRVSARKGHALASSQDDGTESLGPSGHAHCPRSAIPRVEHTQVITSRSQGARPRRQSAPPPPPPPSPCAAAAAAGPPVAGRSPLAFKGITGVPERPGQSWMPSHWWLLHTMCVTNGQHHALARRPSCCWPCKAT